MEGDARREGHTYKVYIFCFKVTDIRVHVVCGRGGEERRVRRPGGHSRAMSQWRYTRMSVLGRTPMRDLVIGRLSQATRRELPRKHATGVRATECDGVFRQGHSAHIIS